MKISVIGLGKLGAPLAAVMASKGHEVMGLDLNTEYVEALNAGKAPVQEPRLQEFIDAGRERLRATMNYESAVLNSEISFIVVPTPSDGNGVFSNEYVLASVREIGKVLQHKDAYHVVNITSTVMPGSTGGEILAELERHSGKRVGEEIGLCYNPEFIALGSVVQDMLTPDMLLIGESDPRAGDLLESVYKISCDNSPAVQRMNFVNAELTKISVNTFVTTKISYANMLADICDHLPGADVDEVTTAIGRDSRIGNKYLKGALGYGGPCFPRDNVAFAALARNIGAHPDIAEATDRINNFQIERLAGLVKQRLAPGGKVGILGMSYKPDTAVVEESQGLALAKLLAEQGYSVSIYDPQAMDEAMSVLGERVSATKSAEECSRSADMLLITTPWPEFRDLDPATLRRDDGKPTILDCWRILPRERFGEYADIAYLGFGLKGMDGA